MVVVAVAEEVHVFNFFKKKPQSLIFPHISDREYLLARAGGKVRLGARRDTVDISSMANQEELFKALLSSNVIIAPRKIKKGEAFEVFMGGVNSKPYILKKRKIRKSVERKGGLGYYAVGKKERDVQSALEPKELTNIYDHMFDFRSPILTPEIAMCRKIRRTKNLKYLGLREEVTAMPAKFKTVENKKLIITITGTDRKRRELERALRTFVTEYTGKKGVYNITVHEENTVTTERLPIFKGGEHA